MIYFLATVACMLLLFVVWLQIQVSSEREAWQEERRELLNRIQRPEVLPIRPVEGFTMPERKLDEWDKVGTIDLSEPDANG